MGIRNLVEHFALPVFRESHNPSWGFGTRDPAALAVLIDLITPHGDSEPRII